jgi:hypothetical protein
MVVHRCKKVPPDCFLTRRAVSARLANASRLVDSNTASPKRQGPSRRSEGVATFDATLVAGRKTERHRARPAIRLETFQEPATTGKNRS